MSLTAVLGQIATDALPTVLKLMQTIADSGDQRSAAEQALRALIADAADAATDEAVDAALKANG